MQERLLLLFYPLQKWWVLFHVHLAVVEVILLDLEVHKQNLHLMAQDQDPDGRYFHFYLTALDGM